MTDEQAARQAAGKAYGEMGWVPCSAHGSTLANPAPHLSTTTRTWRSLPASCGTPRKEPRRPSSGYGGSLSVRAGNHRSCESAPCPPSQSTQALQCRIAYLEGLCPGAGFLSRRSGRVFHSNYPANGSPETRLGVGCIRVARYGSIPCRLCFPRYPQSHWFWG